ncbi:MAG: ribonuclease Z [Bacillota bacterium]|nr:ribonuclease Z [Bacillota bacterium]
MLDICLLGCGGSMPTPNRSLTALLVAFQGRKILIDCGEGTQVSLKMVGWGFKSIDAICFTHYHADHVVGLPGLLLTIANSDRTEPLKLIGPVGLRQVVAGLTVIAPNLPYELELIEVGENERFTECMGGMTIHTLPVEHTIPCMAYGIEVKRERKFDPLKAKENNVPVQLWSKLQKGNVITHEGRQFTPGLVLGEERKGLKLFYSTDTRPTTQLGEFIKDADLFICEGMYGDDNDLNKALENKHMLFTEAARLAKNAKAKELWLTHYSPSLVEPENYLENAKMVFDNTHLGRDRTIKSLNFYD